MLKKFISIIFILILIFVIFFEENTFNKTVQVNEQGILNETPKNSYDEMTETSLTGSDKISQTVTFAPEFTLTDLSGADVKLSDFKGKIVILNFWATWCPPCREEMPAMQKFYEQNKENGIEIVAVNLTNIDNGVQAVESFVQDYGLTFPILLDKDGVVGNTYGILTLPTSYILDPKGGVIQKIIGPMNEQMMTEIVNSIQMDE
ncbi:TlpA disulfide reductase family protein [Ureibacillus thermosphaericus]|uniref:TlpA disulfide reductase family protein n=2 Tax=Ureibacillus TaxID=160795 RepID=UPI0030C96825